MPVAFRPARARSVALATLAVAAIVTPSRAQTPRTLTLDEAIRLSLELSPATVAGEVGVSTARANLLQARGSWLPNLNLNSWYANSSNERFDQTTGRLVSQSYTTQLQGSYDLFTGGRRLAQNRSAGAALDAADAEYVARRFDTELATTRVYYAAAAASDLLGAAEARLERARQQASFANTRLEIGTATRSDVLRAQIELGNAEIAVLDARAELAASSLQLGRQVGLPEPVQPAAAALPDTAPTLPPVEELVQRAVSRSPAVLAAEAERESAHADRLAAYTPYIPTLRLVGGYDWFAFDFPPDQRSWSLRVTASLPVFNGFQREAALQRASAFERLAEVEARDAELGARVAVASAASDIDAAQRRVAIADRATELAREDLRVQEERYQLGVTTILELQASQVALAEAEAAAVRARQTLGTAIAQLEAVLGERIAQE